MSNESPEKNIGKMLAALLEEFARAQQDAEENLKIGKPFQIINGAGARIMVCLN